MAVGYRSSSLNPTPGDGGSSVTSRDVPVPTGAASGDIVLVAFEMWETTSTSPTVTPPAGFTLVLDLNIQDTNNGAWQKMKVWWKRLTGSDTGNYTFTWTASHFVQAAAMAITGVVTTGDPIGTHTNTASSTSGATIPTTTISSLAFEPFLAHFVVNSNSRTQTPPTSFTEDQEGNYIKANHRIPGTTGSFSAASGTLSSSTTIVAALLALEPDAGNVPKSDTDSGTLTESASLAVVQTDIGTFIEVPSIAMSASQTDSATLTETHSIMLNASDSATLTEIAAVSVALSQTDSAVFTDDESLNFGQVDKTDDDRGFFSDSGSLTVAIAKTDTFTLLESIFVDRGDVLSKVALDVSVSLESIDVAAAVLDDYTMMAIVDTLDIIALVETLDAEADTQGT